MMAVAKYMNRCWIWSCGRKLCICKSRAHLQGSLQLLHLGPRPAEPPLQRRAALLQVLGVRAGGRRLPPARVRVLLRRVELGRGPRVGGLERGALRGCAERRSRLDL